MMTRRKGLSLTEVLVAIFTCAIGLVALMSLFPVGAVNMAQAIKDDRTAQAASAADAYMRWYWKHYVLEAPATYAESFVEAMRDPNDPTANPGPGLTIIKPKTSVPALLPGEAGPSYPVVVDPMGWVAPWATNGSAQQRWWVANDFIPRRSLGQIPTSQPAYSLRTCSLLDGFTFDEAGRPNAPLANGGVVEREYRYNWLWVLQRPSQRDLKTAAMTVVVFDKRAFQFVPPAAEQLCAPVPNGAAVGSTALKFSPANRPNVIKGGWIADITVTATQGGGQGIPAVRNFNFYRVVSITDNPTDGNVDVELQVPLKPDSKSTGVTDIPANLAGTRRFVVMAGVSEVFDRGYLSPGDD